MNKKVKVLKFIELPYGIVELRSDDILTFRPDISRFNKYNIQILKELLEVFIEITDGIPRPYLCDNRYITGIVNKEEQAYMNEHFSEFATRAAMVTKSPVVNVIVNSYNTVFKPKVMLKLFGSEDKAIDWLLEN